MAPEHIALVSQATDIAELSRRFGMPLDKAAERLETLKRRDRHRRGIARTVPTITDAIDPEDEYGDAIRVMMQHAEPKRRRL